ncbi:P-loop containing nucleoside triphosphate hydrolase protein [Penicillium chermesinum]|uniref:ABC multidrug transporter MDR2 n=1 Tax=Penicillium chermesinum TaxID=63820 RepID=A0A9W9NI69_9EURO|nr:P-loop containing nucleoside triphosphate hydrolase protein [Penicillium chermesinum]KAJ5220435.1 P-loop containing nucleoside triphosphate hydrolase protein [Penicillium chermesinum]KAJ6157872.1 P-loop containing nucleoside triphosphate hydrolase protein [Penicillium chermesinum]
MRWFKKISGYASLLVACNPSKLDLTMLVVGFFSSIGSGVPFPIIGIIFGQLLDDFNSATCSVREGTATSASQSSDQKSINKEILLIVYLAIAQFVLIYIHLTCWTMTGARLAQRLRENYLKNLLRQEPSYFDNLPPGAVASRLNSDIQTIRSGTSEKVGIVVSAVSFFITAYIVAFIKDWKLAAMLLSLIPAYLLMSFVGSHYIEKYSGLMSDYAASAASIASEALSNIVVVQAFGANTRLEKKFSKELKSSESEGLKKAVAVGIQSGVLYFVAYGANGLAFWQASKSVAHSGATVGATFTVIFILIEATLLFSQVSPFLHLFIQAVASYSKLREDLDRVPQIDGTSTEGIRLAEAQGKFEFKNVSFTYPSRPEVTVLDKISLSIPAKKHTALVGLSGSGKSTIAGLVTRLYDPNEGQVTFDDHDLHELNVRDLRSHIGLVQQEPSLLDRSLLENIAHGLVNSSNPSHAHLKETFIGCDLEELAADLREGKDLMTEAAKRGTNVVEIVNLVQKAAGLADAESFISRLQYGLGTIVGSSGRLISGGQKQRISLARALVRDPAVLVLDEATASLDSRSEQRIQQAINNIATGRTIISIAHRLSTIQNADNIIIMHKGHVVEQGDHAALMAKDGSYAELVKLQTLSTDKSGTVSGADSASRSDQSSLTDGDIEKSESTEPDILDEKAPTTTATPAPTGEEETAEDEPKTPSKSLWALLKGYAPTVRPHLLIIALALIGASIVGGAFSGEAVIFGNTVGSLNPCNTADYIESQGRFYGLMFFVLAIIELFANIVSWAGFGWVSEKVVYTVRVLSFRSLFEQDLQWHQSNGRTPPLLLSYITRDGNALAGLSGSVIGTLFSITVNLIAAIILTHIIAWKIALVCLSLVPLLLGAGLMELHVLGKFEERHENAYATSVDIGVEAITSIKTIASLSLEDETLKTYRKSLKGPQKETFNVTLQASLWQSTTYFLGNCVNALAYWWGAKQIISGTYTQTQFLIVVFSLLVSALLWSQMFALAPELSQARAASARILGLIEMGSDKMRGTVPDHTPNTFVRSGDAESAMEAKSIQQSNKASSVQLQDVHFAYPARPDMKVLNGLTVDIRPGQFCALVGPSGAGKSTIISLAERLYVPESGSILIDGRDVSKTRDPSFRDSISLVPQESVLFEGTVEFNIGLGARPGQEATMEEIIDACKLANIHETIASLPEGYKTMCGPNGNQFSGGQKQRLSIARALVRKPKLLILDESTSALDAESEKLLQDGLEKAAKGITVIAIAHRLHTIRKANVIFLIEAGQCIDKGSHEELLERSESYRANVMHQTVAT